MKDVFHPGIYIKEEMEARDITQVQLATILGVSKSYLSQVLNGDRNISIPFALKLEKIWDIPAETYLSLQLEYDIEMERKKNKPITL